jgi:hypothetical protein
VQAHLRHARATTTLDIYIQEIQRRFARPMVLEFFSYLINSVDKSESKREYKCLNFNVLPGGRSQDRTVDLLLVRLGLHAYVIDSVGGHLLGTVVSAAYSALIAHGVLAPSKCYWRRAAMS